ncbi:SDR family NAD(P)-dependent oxidoreductase [Butyrivibrio sp. XPD2002]|uniref:SDR family NAD(P)-dependent oxidoreductase n=1 Tax=Butyrivibrio sp. XPD2002 TaxID=1280665 RepID=UPI0003FC7C19|nr:SDR family oxidoreductase [Butyrivibrio sp. XPD2002]
MKTVLVIGASSDIGVATIDSISDSYDYIIAHYFHMNDKLQELKNKLSDRMIMLQADLSIEQETKNLTDKLKELDMVPDHIIHFPAQQIQINRYIKMDWPVFQRGLDISLKSFVLITQALLPKMTKRKSGKIIVMLSYVVDGMPPKYSADYVTIKYALLGLVKALALEYAEKGITVNGISPGFTETKFVGGLLDYYREENANLSPIGRNLVVSDIIPTIKFLLSDGSNAINGQNISVTFGR